MLGFEPLLVVGLGYVMCFVLKKNCSFIKWSYLVDFHGKGKVLLSYWSLKRFSWDGKFNILFYFNKINGRN